MSTSDILATICIDPRLVAYNRVALTDYFQHRNVEKLYLNQGARQPVSCSPRLRTLTYSTTADWYAEQDPSRFQFYTGEAVTSIDTDGHTVTTDKGRTIAYDICVLSTGSDATLPDFASPPPKGVFVYRNLSDLNKLLEYSQQDGVSGHPVSLHTSPPPPAICPALPLTAR